MAEAAAALSVTPHKIRYLIQGGVLPAEQVVPGAPYQFGRSTCIPKQCKPP